MAQHDSLLWLWCSDALLVSVALVCLVTDLALGKIYNRVTYAGFLGGLLLAGLLGDGSRLAGCLLGGLIGFVFLFPFFLLKGIGGGDVKLMAAVGAIKGYPYIVYAIFWGSLLGGALAISLLIWKGRLIAALRNAGWVLYTRLSPKRASESPAEFNRTAIPYGASLGIGAVVANYLDFLKV